MKICKKQFNFLKEDLIRDFEILKSFVKIAKKYGVNKETIRNKFIKFGIPYKHKVTKYYSNEDFFNKDTEASFYWAGFIAADGCVYENKKGLKQLILKLAEKDLSHLESFKIAIETDSPISLYKNLNSLRDRKWNDTFQYQLRITSVKIFNDLKRFNIVPRKTKIYNIPEWLVTHPFISHFMRGYIDGDGCISFGNLLKPNWSLSIRGNISMLHLFKYILEINCGLNSKATPKISSGTGNLYFGGRRMVCKIIDFLYRDSTIYLKRKYDIAKLSYNSPNLK